MRVLADSGMAHGHNTLGDALFLAAFIVAVLACVLHFPRPAATNSYLGSALLCAAVALIALGWFVL